MVIDPLNAPHFTSARRDALAASITAQAQTRELNNLRTERDRSGRAHV